MTVMTIKTVIRPLICAAALLCLLTGCGGGFGADGAGAKELGPSVFEPDSTG